MKWVYKTKNDAEGKNERHKAQFVVKGYKQQHGRDYIETFSHIERMETIEFSWQQKLNTNGNSIKWM